MVAKRFRLGLLILSLGLTTITYSAEKSSITPMEVQMDSGTNMMAAAHDYSEERDANGLTKIGIYMLAGNEYAEILDIQINKMFRNAVAEHGVTVKVFVERTTEYDSSLFKAYVGGEGIGVKTKIEDFNKNLSEAIKKAKSNSISYR